MRTSRTFISAALAAAAGLALLGGAVATAQEDDGADDVALGVTPEELIDRLVELELDLGDASLRLDVSTDPESERLTGDYVGLQVLLENNSDRTRSLFIDADDASGPVAAAVSDVARSLLTLENVAARLALFEDHDLERSLGSVDDDAVATGADALVGQLEIAIASYEDAVLRAWPAYGVLRDAAEADDQERALFDDDFEALQVELDESIPALRRLVSTRTTAVMAPVDRFDATAGEARARSMTVACIDRTVYALDTDETAAPPGDEAPSFGDPFEAADCPDLPVSVDEPGFENRVTVSAP